MVIFDQLRLSDDGRKMYINAHVNRAQDSSGSTAPFANVYISKVVVTDASRVYENMDLDTIITHNKYLWKKEYASPGVKEVDLVLDSNDFWYHEETEPSKINFCKGNMNKTLFFVFIQTTGEVGAEYSCLPCYMQRPVTVGVTFDESLFYQKVMGYTKELANDCEIPKGFIDLILQWNAFKTAVDTEHFVPALKFYNMMFGNDSGPNISTSTKGCGCHG